MPVTRRQFVYAAVAAGAALIALGPIADGDIYWHLAAGAEMWRRHGLLRTDPFTVSAAGRPWVDVHWLFQLGAAAIHRASGFLGLAVAKAVIVAAGAVVATRAAERGGGPRARDTCAVGLLALLFLARHLLPLRPIVVTLLFIAAFIALLERHRVDSSPRTGRTLLALAALQAVWVNCQGLAPIGPGLVAAYLLPTVVAALRGSAPARRSAVPLALALAACLVASLITPYGVDAVLLPGRLLARIEPTGGNIFSAAVAENIPPFVLERTAPEMVAHLRLVLVVFGAALLVVRPRLCAAHALVLGGFVTLALMANRNILLLYWVLAPIGAVVLGPRAAERWATWRSAVRFTGAAPRWAGLATLATVLSSEIGLAGLALAREESIGEPTPFHFPTESARLLARTEARGPVFAADQAGGYLVFSVPGIRPYIDTRLVLHSASEYEDYLAVFDDPARFDALDDREHFRYVVLTTAYPDRYLGLVAHLAASPDWTLRFTDGSEVLFARVGAGGEAAPIDLADRTTVEAVAAAVDARFATRAGERAAARLNLGRLLVVLGQPAHAERVIEPLTSRPAAELRARAHFAARDLDAAEGLARVLLLEDPDDARSLTLLAEIAIARRSRDDARRYLARALCAKPFDAEARALLERLELGPSPALGAHAD